MKKGLKKKIILLGGLLSCITVLAGCTSTSSGDSSSASSAVSSVTASESTSTSSESTSTTTTEETPSTTTTTTDDSSTTSEATSSTTTEESSSTTTTTEDSTSTTSESTSTTTDEVVNEYVGTFVATNCTIYVYDTQDMSGTGEVTTTAVAKDGTTGDTLTDGNGQINFIVVPDSGYTVDSTCISISGTYKNLKGPTDTGYTNGYRITKVQSDLTITVTAAVESTSTDTGDTTDTEEGYTATFSLSNCTVYVFDTQDMSGTGTITTSCLSRDGDTGVAVADGTGQINFIVVPDSGYVVSTSCITITGSYKNLKGETDTGVTNGYRITKVASDLTIEITAILESEAAQTVTSFSIESTYGLTTYTLTGSATAGSFTYTYIDGLLTIDAADSMDLVLSGTYYGGIVINSSYTTILELSGATLNSYDTCPLYINSSEDVDIKVVSGTENYVNDYRDAVASDSTTDVSASIYVTSDLALKGTGSLTVYSANNNGIHGKDDLEAQKLTLTVNVLDNALKGNDSVTINSGTYTLIARQGDCIKTSSSDLSSSNVQRGSVTINDGTLNLYAACDGIDAAYDVVINNSPVINIYTDKYSEYSEEVTAVTDSIYYIRNTSTAYTYSIYYYNSSTGAYVWKNSVTSPTYTVNSGMKTYYYYEVEKPDGYDKMYVYVYSSTQTQGQDSSYTKKSSALTINDNYDTIAYSGNNFSFTNYTTGSSSSQGGMGGMGGGADQGNTDKGDYSTKGIKANNAITINGGTIYIKAYDDAIHANNDETIESGVTPEGAVTINGGTVTVYSNDDGIHADGTLTIADGTVSVTNSYEGIEGEKIIISGGTITVISSDDGFNSTLETGSYGIQITGGYIYVYAGGDGLDANTTTSYGGILFNGGRTVVISTSSGNSCIDTEQGYTYKSGYVVAMCPSGMTSECEKVSGSVSSYGKTSSLTLTKNYYLTVSGVAVIKLPASISSGYVIELGSTSASISQSSSTSYTVDDNGVYWLV